MKRILSAITLFLTFVCKVECDANEITVADGEYIYFDTTKKFCGWYVRSGKRKDIHNDKIIKTNKMLLDLLKKHERIYGENPLKFVINMLSIQISNRIHTEDFVKIYIKNHAIDHNHREITDEIITKLINTPSLFSASLNNDLNCDSK